MKNLLSFTLSLTTLFGYCQWLPQSISFPPDPRDGSFTFVLNDTAYIGAGILSRDFWKFNESTSLWSQKNNVANNKKRAFAAAFEYNNYGYIIGGDSAFGNAMKDVWKYDPANDLWVQLNNFPGGNRVGMLSWKVGNRVFVAGGTNNFNGTGYGTIFKDMYEYLPASDSWSQLADLPFGLAFSSCFTIANKAYFVSGNTGNTTYNSFVFEFDPQNSNGWTMKAQFPGNPRNAGIAVSYQGSAYAGLGQSGFSNNYKDFYQYDPINDVWTPLADFPSPVSAWSVAFTLGDKIYAGTGLQLSTFDFSDKLYAYQLSSMPTNTSTSISSASSDNHNIIYPNPTYDHLYISLGGKNMSGVAVEINDINGKTVLSRKEIYTNAVELDMKGLQPSVYFLKILRGNDVSYHKILKAD